MKKIENVAAYVRVSTTEQKLHGLSLDAQKMKLTEYAKANNMKIVGWYVDEGVSGRKLIRKRPELQRMINDAKKGNFERIIFIKLDRFFRSVAEYHECMKEIAPVVWTTTEEEYDLTTANGRMLVNMKLTIAELEADQTGERINLVNEYKTATGQPITGSMPFGWEITKDYQTGKKKVVKCEEEAPIMEDLLNHFMTFQSKHKTVLYINAKYNLSVSYNTLNRLLDNTMLYGSYRDNPTYCEGYMTKDEFDKMHEIIKRNCRENTSENRVYLFSGLIRCPNCGRLLAGSQCTTRKNGFKYKYSRYRCPKNRLQGSCDFIKTIGENVLERMLLENIGKYLQDAKIRVLEIEDSDEPKVPKYNVDEIQKEIERLNYSWQKGRIKNVEQYDKQYDELLEKLELAEKEQNNTNKKDFSEIEAILNSGWESIYTSLDAEHKKAFWRNIISSIEVNWTTDVKEITKINFF